MNGVEIATILDVLRLAVGVSVLFYASYTDIKTRTAPNFLWLIMGGLGAVFLIVQYLFVGIPNIWYLAFIPIMIGLMYLLFMIGLMFGGADAKALMAIAILTPLWPVVGDAPLYPSLMPFSWIVFVNSLLLFLIIPISLLIYNVVKKNRKFPHMLLGYPMLLEKARKVFVWPLERVVEGKLKIVYRPLDDDEVDVFEGFDDLKMDRIWVTPKIPFMLPLLFGFILSFILGDLLSLLLSLVF